VLLIPWFSGVRPVRIEAMAGVVDEATDSALRMRPSSAIDLITGRSGSRAL